MKFLQMQGYVIYLAIATAISGFYIDDWQYWIINIPTIVLVSWKSRGN